MTQNEIKEKLNEIFRKVFNDSSILIHENMTANDVNGWDSLSHMLLISEVETQFIVRFKLKDLNKMKNVGDMINIIEARLSE